MRCPGSATVTTVLRHWWHASKFVLYIFFFFLVHQATKSDRIYVNAPGMPREENNDIQIMSFLTTKPEDQVQNGEVNASLDMEEEESEENEEVLTPGDLLAFAWQITKAMVRQADI